MIVQNYFDFKQLFKDVLKSTFSQYKSSNDFIEENYIEDVSEKEKIISMFNFLNNKKEVKRLISEFEISEEQTIDFDAEEIEISFSEDTSYHNEGGSHFGGYEYVFKVNTELNSFTSLDIINHN